MMPDNAGEFLDNTPMIRKATTVFQARSLLRTQSTTLGPVMVPRLEPGYLALANLFEEGRGHPIKPTFQHSPAVFVL